MAYPLVIALVVLPTVSKASVIFLTSSGALVIAAMPPALSVMGPNESIATIMPATESMDVAAIAMPKIPAREKLARMPAAIIKIGTKVDSWPMASPMMTLVPWPDSEALAIAFTGRYFLAV